MVDNVTLPGTGEVIATDDIGGVQYQRIKPHFGPDNTATQVTLTDGLPVNTAPDWTSVSYTQAGVIAINTDLAIIDCQNIRWLSVQCVSMGTTGIVTIQMSNDNTNWVNVSSTGVAGSLNTTISASGLYTTPVFARYVRLRLTTATTAGTTTFEVRGSRAFPGVVNQSTNSGTSLIGDVGTQYRANATGAASFVSVLSPATPASATIKGSAGRLLGWQLQNSSAALRSVKIFNATAPTLGTTAAAFEIDIPAGAYVTFEMEGGMAFATAMTYSVTSAKGLTDNTATGLAANDVSGSFFFA